MDAATRKEPPHLPAPSKPHTIALGKRKRTSSTSTQDACVICLDPISERAITVPCNHTAFDFLCLVSWLQSAPRCPLCNVQVSEVQYDWCGPEDYKTYVVEPPAPEAHTATSSRPSGVHGASRSGFGAARNRPHRPYRSPPDAVVSPDTALLRRRAVYRKRLYSLHVGSNRHSRYRDFTPTAFAADQNLQSRARAFVRRELRVFEFLDPLTQPSSSGMGTRRQNTADFLLEYAIAILKTTEPKGGQAEDLLAEFLGRENARLFLHELEAWLRSPFRRLEDWDRCVQYPGGGPGGIDGEGRVDGTMGTKGAESAERRRPGDSREAGCGQRGSAGERRDWRWRGYEPD